ncbi:DNA-processing protein DprA [Nocardia tengchongensis]|uniref:DNA-processing protein DprA n=1 Tax=Nocardia tengchongensis TaxID=2055889 RepID=UPI0036BE112E
MTDSDERLRAWALLARAALVSPAAVRTSLAAHGPLEAAHRIAADARDSRLGPLTRDTAEQDLHRASRAGARQLTRDDPGWPTALADLDTIGAHAPIALWARGTGQLNLLTERAIAIVGARAATNCGQRIAAHLASGLGDRGWTVLSGGAFGVDAAAHQAALDGNRPTVAVLPAGLHRLFPHGNAYLLAKIEETGLLLSEYPPGVEPARPNFLARNRIVAAMTTAVVVPEAGLRSGTANTVRWANKLHRPVTAVPGPIDSTASRGCHEFIRTGQASLAVDAQDVLDALTR